MSKIDISVIIVNYNVKEFLYQCLKSLEIASEVANKNNISTEIIVIDNNSTDNSIEYLQPRFLNVKFIKLKENLGFGIANNIAIKQACGKYLLILNPDTVVEENNLLMMYEFMTSHTDVGACGCKVLNADGTFQLACRRGLPTPWASFCKLFGLQRLFPKSKLFAQYNQTFRSINETYNIDVLIGAYMFVRKEVFDSVGGFDEDFFMYGEDIDLCYKITKHSWKIVYFHETSIIHYKGESTRRSSINEVKHFYESMKIFSTKNFNSSRIFLFVLKTGIMLRTILAYFGKFRRQLAIIIFDLIFLNVSIMIGTYYKFGDYFNLPDYAYPTVFIIVNLIVFSSMVSVGEYFEGKNTIRRSFFGLMMSFFILSSMTYYFREYAFSRGILLFTIGFTTLTSVILRFLLGLYDRISGKEADRRIAIVGINEETSKIVNQLKSGEARNLNLIGLITNENSLSDFDINIPVIGNIKSLASIIDQFALEEIIIADPNINKSELLKLISSISDKNVKFHLVTEYEELVASRIINDISRTESLINKYNILKLRFRFLKRGFDILGSFFLLTIALPIVYLFSENKSKVINGIWKVFIGKFSLIGLFSQIEDKPMIGKIGLTGLAQISKIEGLNPKIIQELNEYYIINYSFSLDVDILLKHFFRK